MIYREWSIIRDMNESIGERLRKLRGQMTQPEFAKIAGSSKQHVSRIEKGLIKEPSPAWLAAWASHFKVRLEWLTTGQEPKEAATVPPPSEDTDWADVTGYSQAAGLGSGPEAQEWAETHKLKFRRDSLSRKRLSPQHLAVMYGAGDSMWPTIKEGDAILFDTTDTVPKNKGVYVILIPGAGAEEYMVKRALVSKGVTTFVSDNLDGDHDWKEPRPMDDGIKVVGRVRWTGGWIK